MRHPLMLAAFASAIAIGAAPAAAQDCKPSKWGAKDEIGSANLVTPERTKPRWRWSSRARAIRWAS